MSIDDRMASIFGHEWFADWIRGLLCALFLFGLLAIGWRATRPDSHEASASAPRAIILCPHCGGLVAP